MTFTVSVVGNAIIVNDSDDTNTLRFILIYAEDGASLVYNDSYSSSSYDTRNISFFNNNPLEHNTTYNLRITLYGSPTENYTITTDSIPGTAVCFLGDAPVLTAHGYRPIREFRVGDSVMTADGREVAVTRVFRKVYSPSVSANPYVIPKGMFGATRPVAISPNHEVLVSGRGMVKARDLGLKRMKMTEEFTYYNLELEDWVRDNLVVAGVTCESLAPAARISMTKAEFKQFVTARYGPEAARRLKSICMLTEDGRVSMPALR